MYAAITAYNVVTPGRDRWVAFNLDLAIAFQKRTVNGEERLIDVVMRRNSKQ